MAGLVSGLRMAEALASLPDGLDRDLARVLLIAAEAPFLAAHAEQWEAEKKG